MVTTFVESAAVEDSTSSVVTVGFTDGQQKFIQK